MTFNFMYPINLAIISCKLKDFHLFKKLSHFFEVCNIQSQIVKTVGHKCDVGELEIAIVLQHVVPDRVHQVRLPQPHTAVDEQRVVGA